MIKSKFGVGVLSKIKLTGIKAESYKLQNTSWKRWTDVINAFSSWSKTLDCLSVHDPSKVIAWLYVWPCLSAFVFYGFCCCRFICLFVPCHLFLIFSSPIYPACIYEFFDLFLCLLVRACVRAGVQHNTFEICPFHQNQVGYRSLKHSLSPCLSFFTSRLCACLHTRTIDSMCMVKNRLEMDIVGNGSPDILAHRVSQSVSLDKKKKKK